MDTLIYLDSIEGLADYERFSVERDSAVPFWVVVGWKRKERTKLAEFITCRHALLFRALCESTAAFRQIATGARKGRGSLCVA